jgi:class 3 adenylate cyclase
MAAPSTPAAERKLVSVLFADLVGFTTLSESRDAEEVRDLLTRYFDQARQIIGRYGGTIEKFIGDAVMAVWGTPVAQEDDAERAVRAALDLTAAVSALGSEVGAPDLKARAGVLTGEAVVNIGAEGQGMVAGDLVNTASRIQSVASPGSVFVGEATKRATEASIAYEDAGTHELKGKAEPARLWRAVRVVAGRAGSLKSSGLEAPFIGRDREMRLIKELFHGSADQRKAHLVSVMGIAGIGKSRLSLEFEKYTDGLAGDVWWHRGRCLAYGEGVAYWALAEMVRMRAGIAEGEEPTLAYQKLRAAIGEFVPDPEESRWVEPRLAHLLALEERTAHDQAELISAWRLFFERLSDRSPTIMVFEDLQWADTALLDFIEYLLDWSRDHPIFIITLARPELSDRRPSWGAARRNFTSLYLEPLESGAMRELLAGLVPGLPKEIRDEILERAEGVPLYAVETVRMLIDRGLLIREGAEYRPIGPTLTLEVPETLQALIAARLDGLGPDERRLVQDASVVGKTFTRAALSALSSLSEEDLQSLLASLVRKEFFTVQADPRSSERGQYGFLQDLVKRVAYESLSKKDRKARHLAVAAYLEDSWGSEEEEIVEVVASHYLEAYRAAPEAMNAGDIKGKARGMLMRAAQRAASLAASEEAQRYYLEAAQLAEDPLVEAELLEQAGRMAWFGGRGDLARRHFEQAIKLFEAREATHPAARVSARLGDVIWAEGHIEQAVERMERSFEVLMGERPDEDLATLAAQLGRLLYFMGKVDRATERIEQALEMAESLWLPEVLSQALNTKSLILLTSKGRPEEGLALLRHALQVALDNDVPSAAQRAYYNLSNLLYYRDRHDLSLEYARDGLALARRYGEREWEWNFLSELVSVLFLVGDWEQALATTAEIPPLEELPAARFAYVELLLTLPQIYVARGLIEAAIDALEPFSSFGESADIQERTALEAARAVVLRAQGDLPGAISAGREASETSRWAIGAASPAFKVGVVEAIEASLASGDLDLFAELLDPVESLPAGQSTPYLRAQAMRFRARAAVLKSQVEGVEPGLKEAAGLFREIGVPFWLAVTLLEHAEWLVEHSRGEDAKTLLAEAREIFERLEARPWLERVAMAGGEPSPALAASAGGEGVTT